MLKLPRQSRKEKKKSADINKASSNPALLLSHSSGRWRKKQITHTPVNDDEDEAAMQQRANPTFLEILSCSMSWKPPKDGQGTQSAAYVQCYSERLGCSSIRQ